MRIQNALLAAVAVSVGAISLAQQPGRRQPAPPNRPAEDTRREAPPRNTVPGDVVQEAQTTEVVAATRPEQKPSAHDNRMCSWPPRPRRCLRCSSRSRRKVQSKGSTSIAIR